MKRRTFLKGSALGSMVAFFASSNLNASLLKDKDLLNFKEIPASTEDKVIVPDGYKADILISWGDPLFSKASIYDEEKNIDKKAVENAKLTFGDNNDGMSFFPLSKDRAILAINNEYINPEIMFKHQGKNLSLEDILYEQANLGVSIFEIKKEKDQWSVVLDSKYNRRIDANTKMSISGPAKQQVLQNENFIYGTLNNCANGKTPWGTYLTCEENINDFFGSLDEKIKFSKEQLRFGFKAQSQYGWEKFDERFDLSKNPNEANKFGWVVEIDPFDPNSIPIKRTALGRFKHENAELIVEDDGTVVIYMGDDEANEFIYKFISKHKYKKGLDTSKILDEGTLYVAQFNGKIGNFRGSGKWIELEYGKNNLNKENGFNSQADVLINARIAGTIVNATPMDRCEWIASHKESGSKEVFATLTNNKKNNNPNPANPRTKNIYGQIIKWEHKNSHKDDEFTWEIFALAGNPDNQTSLNKGSNNITSNNKFNSPDGLSFDRDGRLWIQTDGNYSNQEEFEGMGNNCMLAANPKTGEIKRFLTGPIACEITGIAFSQDYKTMFVGIQHPGEKLKGSQFPYGKTPRSSIIAISKIDGGVIGS
ncbi:PhoX family phosphatase [Campylobacter lari]|uniref:PhoX family phosphatase n=1 Tax=Campylobacter lari TaxID=201 RepID=A0A5L4NNH9_CAMLA|nr:PhoX family phosphatase [Campylobacter sp. CNRCH_2013_0898h]EAI3905504.1 PhoX family phosphatase [Campylobacter lari]EAI3913896.1 PhoX family phosphatase [Campylobacter lari]EAI4449725.1 PhoX family phosphatase [Campylobacter lari]EAK0828613.1 PhoX family phosphatase [Campylobacter lari]MCV3553319.1 PhoX family phosphatase [Campylobacter sp. CNRCH_2013_0898h]